MSRIKYWWLMGLIIILIFPTCVGVRNMKADKNIRKEASRRYRVVTFMNLYCKPDEEFKAFVMKKIEGTDYIKPVRWEMTERLHRKYIGWAYVYYKENGS